MNKEQKLERFAEREFKRNINSIIMNDDDGGYIVFGKYRLVAVQGGVEVQTITDSFEFFSSKRTALSWCIADHNNQLNLANNIKILDQKKQILSADLYCRRSVAERSRHEGFSEIVNTKIQPKIESYKSLNNELEKCLISAKYIQIRGFNNETARSSGTQSRKTNI